MNKMDTIISNLIATGLATNDSIAGCTSEEIQRLEAHSGVRLPEKYRDFLRTMGHGAGAFFRGIDIFYNDYLFSMKQVAKEILEERPTEFELPSNAYIFCMEQGFVFYYFDLSEGDNPPVYWYRQGEESAARIADSFSDYLLTCIEEEAQGI